MKVKYYNKIRIALQHMLDGALHMLHVRDQVNVLWCGDALTPSRR